MARKVARKIKSTKPLIYIFCEGPSEEAYMKQIKRKFEEYAVLRVVPGKSGSIVFQTAENNFKKDKNFIDDVEITNEIWIFFDVEKDERQKWDERYKIIKYLRKPQRKVNIQVRLLMTTACVEYWFLPHYENAHPPLTTKADKDRIESKLQEYVPGYYKGDPKTAAQIAKLYPQGIKNGKWVLSQLHIDSVDGTDIKAMDERNRKLYQGDDTFTTVHEALMFLESLRSS